MQLPVLALADDIPNYEAIRLSPGVGWMLLAALVCLSLFFLAHRDSWRKLWLRLDDPRPMAAMRIAFGLCALCNVNGLWELFNYLFMDEGLFPTDIAQHYRARSQFDGYGEGLAVANEAAWFYDFKGFREWLKGPNYSLLLFNSSPKFFWGYLIVFEVVMVMFIIGFRTKYTKWLAWFLFMGIILRNTLFWEATENVYRVFFFYLALSRCGEAWSVDNWLRCRKLRKQGRLSEHGKPGGGAGAIVDQGDGKVRVYEPIYRPIPGWPRLFVILNVAVLYCATGTLKNGPVWNRGDAFYYAFNLDHFYRLPPQQLSSVLGTTMFRLNTWVVHWWEALFPLLVLGLILRWHKREKIPRLEGWRLWMARVGLGGFAAWFYAIILWSYPVHYKVPKGGFSIFGLYTFAPEDSLRAVQWIVGISVPLAAVAIVAGYRWLNQRWHTPRDERGALPWLDLGWVCRWPLGRRVWLVLGLIFHGHLILMMNIGWFSPGLLACYFAFLNGEELAFMLSKIGRGLHKRLKIPMPAHVREGRWAPAADRSLALNWRKLGTTKELKPPKGSALQQPWSVLFTGLGLVLTGILLRIYTSEDMWAELGKIASRYKFDLPPGLVEQSPVIEPNWYVVMAGVVALIAIAQRRAGRGFNPFFAPVIVLTGALGGVLVMRELADMAWIVGAVAVLTIIACRVDVRSEPQELPAVDPDTGQAVPRWAYGPLGRTLITVLSLYHIGAVASTQFPSKDSWSTFHHEVDDSFKHWLRTTQTTQGWGMFAPNPPRRNVFMRVTVTDQDGEIYDLNTDVYACFLPGATPDICEATYPIPWIWYSRQRKINRRIAGSEGGHGSWYQKWHARYICRKWTIEHGERPRKVELYKITYPIRSPKAAFRNPYDPKTEYNRRGHHKKIHTTECAGAVLGQVPNFIRERYGMEPIDEANVRYWNKRRCRKWEQKLIDDAREKYGEDIDILDPRFDVCPDSPTEVKRLLAEQRRARERAKQAEAEAEQAER